MDIRIGMVLGTAVFAAFAGFGACGGSNTGTQGQQAGGTTSGGTASSAAGGNQCQREGKVGVCHRTGSEANPYEFICVSSNATDAHRDHGDVLDVSSQADCPRDAPVSTAGCADGQREAFLDAAQYPNIAACAGGFSLPGIHPPPQPSCGRVAGDDSANPTGTGCAASDLCATGWHVCSSEADVTQRAADGCAGAADAAEPMFFVTGQSSTGCLVCALGTTPDCTGGSCAAGCADNHDTANDLFGCGTLGSGVGSCGALTMTGHDQCGSLGADWNCAGTGLDEANVVTKPGVGSGGVMCCRDR